MKYLGGHIFYVDDADVAYNNENGYPDPAIEDGGYGYYFEDETEQLQGPFDTKEEAEEALLEYNDNL